MKYVFAVTAASLLLVVAGCGSRADAEDAASQPTQESVAETETTSPTQGSEEIPEMPEMPGDITYTAVLAEDARIDDSTVSLSLTDVSSENEAGLQEDLVLNLADTQVNEIESQLQKGTKVEFTLAGNAIMTFSIPPQIPGDSVMDIQVID